MLTTPYKPLPISFSHGKGVWLWDTNDQQYLDALSGIAVCSLGHAHPAVTQAIMEQAPRLLHTSNVYQIESQLALAEKLTSLAGMEQVFFANSGAEANETAIKLARLYGHQQGIAKPAVIVMEHAFHGRTMATLSASGSRKVHAGFEPLVPGFIRAPFDDLAAIETIAQNTSDVVAVLLEPIQGEGGVHIPSEDYLPGLRALCDKHNWLMMLDEVQTGVGRTGQLYMYQHYGITPDVLCTAKALGNGIPISACLMRGNAVDLFKPGTHGSTFGGNPLSSHVALTVLETLEKDNLLQHATDMGHYLLTQLQTALGSHPHVTDIRGKGLMMGIEFDTPCRDMMKIGLEQRILFNITADKVMRLLPPIIITREEADELVLRLTKTVAAFFT